MILRLQLATEQTANNLAGLAFKSDAAADTPPIPLMQGHSLATAGSD